VKARLLCDCDAWYRDLCDRRGFLVLRSIHALLLKCNWRQAVVAQFPTEWMSVSLSLSVSVSVSVSVSESVSLSLSVCRYSFFVVNSAGCTSRAWLFFIEI
jgi:hypothetical protein